MSDAFTRYHKQAQRARAALDSALRTDDTSPLTFRSPDRHANAWMVMGNQVASVNRVVRSHGIDQQFWQALHGHASRHHVSDETLAQTYTLALTAYVCAAKRAELVSRLPLLALFGEAEAPPEMNTPAHWFLDNATSLMAQIETALSIWGKSYLHKRRNISEFPVELDWVSPVDIRPRVDIVTGEILGYLAVQFQEEVPIDDVVYHRYFNPVDDADGVSPFEVAMSSIATERSVVDFAAAFFKNGARPDTLLSYEGHQIDDRTMKEWTEQYRRQHQGVDNAHRVGTLPGPGKWTAQQIGSLPEKLVMPELVQIVRENIISVFGLNPILVGLGEAGDPLSATNTYREAVNQAVEFFAMPEAQRILGRLNREWLSDFDRVFGKPITLAVDEHTVNAFSQATLERTQSAQTGLASTAFDLNEARAFLGRPAAEGVLLRTPEWASRAYQDGTITLNEYRRHIGLAPTTAGDAYIYEIDPRHAGPSAGFGGLFGGLSLPPGTQREDDMMRLPPITRRGRPPARDIQDALARRLAAIRQGQDQDAPPDTQDATADTVEQRFDELRKWRQKQRSHWKDTRTAGQVVAPVEFECYFLPGWLQTLVRGGLAEGWYYGHVFDVATEALRQNEDPEDIPFGVTAEEFEAYWQDLDDLEADLADDWLAYMAEVTGALPDDPTALVAALGQALPDKTDSLVDAWVGTVEAPGPLLRIMLAGVAKGNDILNAQPLPDRVQEQLAEVQETVRQGPIEAILEIDWDTFGEHVHTLAQDFAGDLVRQLNATTQKQVEDLIQRAVDEGWDTDRLQGALQDVLVRDPNNPPDMAAERARLISETEVPRAFNQAAQDRWRAAGVTHAIWQTVRDERVCPICRPLHGQRFPIDEGVMSHVLGERVRSVAHPRCRCFQQPDMNSLSTDAVGVVTQ